MEPSPLASASEYHNQKKRQQFLVFSVHVSFLFGLFLSFFLVPVCRYRHFPRKKNTRACANQAPTASVGNHIHLCGYFCFWKFPNISCYQWWKTQRVTKIVETFFGCFHRPPIISAWNASIQRAGRLSSSSNKSTNPQVNAEKISKIKNDQSH